MNDKYVDLQETFSLITAKLSAGGVIIMTVHGDSMNPFLHNHTDSVYIKKPKTRLNKNDIAFYKRANGVFVLHRVIEVCKNSYVMCGDNMYNVEEGITDSQIIGIVIRYEKNGKVKELNTVKNKFYNWSLPYKRVLKRTISKVRSKK